MREIHPGIYLLSTLVSNCYLIADNKLVDNKIVTRPGLTLIDAGLPGFHRTILKGIQDLGFNPGDLRRILITHSDGDHCGSLAAMKTATGARVYAHPIEAAAIQQGLSSRRVYPAGLVGSLYSTGLTAFRSKPCLVDEHLYGGQILPIQDGLEVLDTPGHTPGHISFTFPDRKVLFAGDSIVYRRGKLRPNRSLFTEDLDQEIRSFKLQRSMQPASVLAGHACIPKDAAALFESI